MSNDELDIMGPMMGMMIVVMMMGMFQPPDGAEDKGTLTGYVRNTSGGAVSGAQVTLSGYTSTTGSDGIYGFSDITPGIYSLGVANAEQLGYAAKTPITVTIVAGANVQDIVLTAQPQPTKANLSGVVRDSNTSGLVNGAIVTLGTSTATTNASGVYSFLNVNPGTYSLVVSKTGYITKSASVTLVAGDNTYDVLLNMTPSETKANLSGTVKDSTTQNRIIGALVTLGTNSMSTDAYGAYSFQNMVVGPYTLTTSKTGYQTKSESVVLGIGNNTHGVLLVPVGVPAAEFEITNLSIVPATVNVGGTVEISALVTNIGTAAGTCTVNCNITPDTFTPLEVVPVPAIDFNQIMQLAMTVMMVSMVMKMAVKAV